jgi:hypothetical protein
MRRRASISEALAPYEVALFWSTVDKSFSNITYNHRFQVWVAMNRCMAMVRLVKEEVNRRMGGGIDTLEHENRHMAQCTPRRWMRNLAKRGSGSGGNAKTEPQI